jgi:hypothetical protein
MFSTVMCLSGGGGSSVTIQQQPYQRSIEDERAAMGRAEAHLRTACRTLVATSSDVVDAMTLSIRTEESGVSRDDWRDLALAVAKDQALHVDVSTRHDHMTIRFTREAGHEDDGA